MNDVAQLHTFFVHAWWFAMGFALMMYIILDGADLGAGIFSLFVRDHRERGAIMATMAGTWDANETWLVVAGGIMFGTFPLVYGSAFHYLMLPMVIVLWSIMMRAVSLEFRHHSDQTQWLWDGLFGLGSLTTVFFAGMSMGATLKGFPLSNDQVPTYVGGLLRFISPFSVWTGVGAVIAAALAGSLFIRARFEHTEDIRVRAARWVNGTFYLALAAVIITAGWSLALFDWVRDKWLGPYIWVWILLGLVVVFATFRMRRATHQERDLAAILWLNAAIAVMWLSMMFTMLPWVVPHTWTVDSGSSPSESLFTFTLAMASFLPVMIVYNWYQIWVFRARINKLTGYGE
jgi:cytochrome d ubiquinol oxidase subunit II